MNITPLTVKTLTLSPIGTDLGLFPADDLFPAEDLFPEFGIAVLGLSEDTLTLSQIDVDHATLFSAATLFSTSTLFSSETVGLTPLTTNTLTLTPIGVD